MKVVVISASPRKIAKTQVFMKYITEYLNNSSLEGLEVKLINLSDGGIDYYTGDGNFSDTTKGAIRQITEADVWIIGCLLYTSPSPRDS